MLLAKDRFLNHLFTSRSSNRLANLLCWRVLICGRFVMKKRFAALFLVLLAGTWLNAQFDSANVLGTVRDSTGAVVIGANVTLTNLETGIASQTATNDAG